MTKLVQMFSARNFTPWPAVLDEVRKNGFDGVEGYSAIYEDPDAFRSMLDECGLTMPQGHFDLDMLETDVARAFDIACKLGIETIIVPWLASDRRPVDHAGWYALGIRLAAIGKKVTEEGFGFCGHNHDFELAPVEARGNTHGNSARGGSWIGLGSRSWLDPESRPRPAGVARCVCRADYFRPYQRSPGEPRSRARKWVGGSWTWRQ